MASGRESETYGLWPKNETWPLVMRVKYGLWP